MMQVGPPNALDDLTLHMYTPCNDDSRRDDAQPAWCVDLLQISSHPLLWLYDVYSSLLSRSNISRYLLLHNIGSIGL